MSGYRSGNCKQIVKEKCFRKRIGKMFSKWNSWWWQVNYLGIFTGIIRHSHGHYDKRADPEICNQVIHYATVIYIYLYFYTKLMQLSLQCIWVYNSYSLKALTSIYEPIKPNESRYLHRDCWSHPFYKNKKKFTDTIVLLLTSRIIQDSKVKCDKIPIYEEDIVDVEVRIEPACESIFENIFSGLRGYPQDCVQRHECAPP